MTPQPMSTKAGYVQFDEMYSGLKNGGVTLSDAWLQVSQTVWIMVSDEVVSLS